MAQEAFRFELESLEEAWEKAKKILGSYPDGRIESVSSIGDGKYRIVINDQSEQD